MDLHGNEITGLVGGLVQRDRQGEPVLFPRQSGLCARKDLPGPVHDQEIQRAARQGLIGDLHRPVLPHGPQILNVPATKRQQIAGFFPRIPELETMRTAVNGQTALQPGRGRLPGHSTSDLDPFDESRFRSGRHIPGIGPQIGIASIQVFRNVQIARESALVPQQFDPAGQIPVRIEQLDVHVQGAVHRRMCDFIEQIRLQPDPVPLQVILGVRMDINPFQWVYFPLGPEPVIDIRACLPQHRKAEQGPQKDDRPTFHYNVSMMSFSKPPAVWRVPAPAPWMSIGEG